MTALKMPAIDFAKGAGLAPAIVQDAATLQVLMVAYMDEAALKETAESGEATFYSRSRGGRWRKGETSGHRLNVVSIAADCDKDAILVRAVPQGPACHRGTMSCFGDDVAPGVGRLGLLERTIAERSKADGYTAKLMQAGARRIAQKVGEEGVEVALAGATGDPGALCEEAADLLYHLIVLLTARGASLDDVMAVLARRAEKVA
jgi:phosphoribosyl-ATP pyrophosphohydrolase/phosphoribosyl-AMP cyclohydrolase